MMMLGTMAAILVLTGLAATESHDGHWMLWALLGFAEGLMTYFIFR